MTGMGPRSSNWLEYQLKWLQIYIERSMFCDWGRYVRKSQNFSNIRARIIQSSFICRTRISKVLFVCFRALAVLFRFININLCILWHAAMTEVIVRSDLQIAKCQTNIHLWSERTMTGWKVISSSSNGLMSFLNSIKKLGIFINL